MSNLNVNAISPQSGSTLRLTSNLNITGHVTASGNISASGTVFADNFQSNR
jgi:phage baseplate assembly protein gpV